MTLCEQAVESSEQHHSTQMVDCDAQHDDLVVKTHNEIPSRIKGKMRWTKRAVIIAAILGIAGFLQGSCYSLLAPFYPMEAEKKGNSASQFGVVFGIYQLMVFLTCPVFGKLLSKQVRAKPLLCSGMVLDGVCCCLMGALVLSPPGMTFFALSLAIRVAESLGFAAVFTCSYAIACSEFPDHVQVFVPIIETAEGLGAMIGPSVGGFLYEAGGFVLPFTVVGSMPVILAVVTAFIFPEIKPAREGSTVTLKDVCNWRVVVDLVMVAACFVTLGFNEATLTVHLKQFGLPPSTVGLIFVILGGVYSPSCFLFGQASERVADPRYLCIIGGVCLLVAFTVMGPLPFFSFQPTVALVCICQALLGAGVASYFICPFMHSVQYAVEYKKLPNDMSTYALLSGCVTSAFSFGLFVGPVVGGVLLDNVGYRWGCLFVVVLQAAVFILLTFTLSCDKADLRLHEEQMPLMMSDGSSECNKLQVTGSK